MNDEAKQKAVWDKIDELRKEFSRLDKDVGLAVHDIDGLKKEIGGICVELKTTKDQLLSKLDFLIQRYHENEGAKKFAGLIKGFVIFFLGAIVSGITIYKFFGD